MRHSILGMILAGGEGTRLSPLTTKRAKPAVPFGGKYRIIDFVLSNFINSGIHSLFVITQFRSQSMTEHIINGWNISSLIRGQFIVPVPAQMQSAKKSWYSGTANAIAQNIHLVKDFNPELLAVFGADHIYKMDISQMTSFHVQKKALATIAAIPVPVAEADQFGIIQVDNEGRITGFQEKPKTDVAEIPGRPGWCLASMGNYIFDAKWICEALELDEADPNSKHDFGYNILPSAVGSGRLYAYNFDNNHIPGQKTDKANYWRDVGTMQAFYEANMDLRTVEPQLDLYSSQWPIHTYHLPLPPAKFVHNEEVGRDGKPRIGKSINSVVCDGCIVSGSTIIGSILSPEVKVHSYSTVVDSILMDGVEIGEDCQIRNAIVDKHVVLPRGTRIGYNRDEDAARFHVFDLEGVAGKWLTVIEKNHDRVVSKLLTGSVNV